MENQLLIAALKAQLFVLNSRLSALACYDHSNDSIRIDWNITSHQVDEIVLEIKRLEEVL